MKHFTEKPNAMKTHPFAYRAQLLFPILHYGLQVPVIEIISTTLIQ